MYHCTVLSALLYCLPYCIAYLAAGHLDVNAKRLGDDEDVGEENGSVQVVASQRLHRHLRDARGGGVGASAGPPRGKYRSSVASLASLGTETIK
eukprot:9466618-Pyramimonas_sp.AAC.1